MPHCACRRRCAVIGETSRGGKSAYRGAQLIERGRIVAGRGYGGSVKLTQAENLEGEVPLPGTPGEQVSDEISTTIGIQRKERALYSPLKATIETTWIKRFGFDEVRVEEMRLLLSK